MATLKDLQAQAKDLGLKGFSKLKKDELEQLLRDSDPDARTALSADDHANPPTEIKVVPHPITNTPRDPELPVLNGSFSHPVVHDEEEDEIVHCAYETETLLDLEHDRRRRDRNAMKRYRKSLVFGRHGARQVQTGTQAG